MQNIKLQDKLIVALDVETGDEALQTAYTLKEFVSTFKIGLPLFFKEGKSLIQKIKALGSKVFLDTKLHDIPNTVYNSVISIAHLEIDYFTVHATGCSSMLESVMTALEHAKSLPNIHPETIPTPIGVTLLTSIDQAMLKEELQVNSSTSAYVLNLAKNAVSSGIHTIVCSAQEVKIIKDNIQGNIILMTPGIRPNLNLQSDQARILTPEAAIDNGSDILIVGRPVVKSTNPSASVQSILESIKKKLVMPAS